MTAPNPDGDERWVQVKAQGRASNLGRIAPLGAVRGHDVARLVIAAGMEPSPDDLRELADAVLERPLVRAALEVRAGGPWALTRAIDLASALLEGKVGNQKEDRFRTT